MKTIDQLIFDALAARRSVSFAGIGTLEVKRRGAKKLSETEIAPPYNEVVFTPDEVEGSSSVVSLVMDEGKINEQEAVSVYGSWLEEALHPDGSIEIQGVGEVKEREFIVARPLNVVLNPNSEKILTMEAKKKNAAKAWAWAAIAVLVLLIAIGVMKFFQNGGFKGMKKKPTPTELVGTHVGAVDSLVVSTVDENGKAEKIKVPVEKGAPVGTGVVGTQPATPPAKKPATQASPAQKPAAAPTTTAAKGSFHVIAGAFSIEKNADNFIAKIKREHPELNPQKIAHPRNGLTMVSIYSASTSREAAGKLSLYWDVNLDLWVYRQR
jgi:cell division septation protein DedD